MPAITGLAPGSGQTLVNGRRLTNRFCVSVLVTSRQEIRSVARRSPQTHAKRQREQAKLEKRRAKEAKRALRKAEKARKSENPPEAELEVELEAEDE